MSCLRRDSFSTIFSSLVDVREFSLSNSSLNLNVEDSWSLIHVSNDLFCSNTSSSLYEAADNSWFFLLSNFSYWNMKKNLKLYFMTTLHHYTADVYQVFHNKWLNFKTLPFSFNFSSFMQFSTSFFTSSTDLYKPQPIGVPFQKTTWMKKVLEATKCQHFQDDRCHLGLKKMRNRSCRILILIHIELEKSSLTLDIQEQLTNYMKTIAKKNKWMNSSVNMFFNYTYIQLILLLLFR